MQFVEVLDWLLAKTPVVVFGTDEARFEGYRARAGNAPRFLRRRQQHLLRQIFGEISRRVLYGYFLDPDTAATTHTLPSLRDPLLLDVGIQKDVEMWLTVISSASLV
jgi:hypothetical protein